VVMVDYPVDLRLVSECVDAPVGQLEELNPSLLRGTTPRGTTFGLRLPEGTKDKYASAIAAIPKDKRVFWRYHRVEAGETLASIAKKYHTTEHAISQANNLEATGLNPDSRVVIPAGGRDALKIAYSRHATRYKVHSGDSVLSVAEDFGVPPEKIRGWNRLKGNQLRSGKVLLIYKPVDSPDPARASAKRPKRKPSTKAKPNANPQQTKSKTPAGCALSASTC
jgi:membrane-bound lytic murein transglycosylase D